MEKYPIFAYLIKLVSPVMHPSPPVVIPSGTNLGHPISTIRIIRLSPLGISESTAPNAVNTNENQKHNNVEHRYLFPIPSDFLKDTCPTRIALVAKDVWGIVPNVAVWVLCHCCHCVVACCWWFTATRLNRRQIFAQIIIRSPQHNLSASF